MPRRIPIRILLGAAALGLLAGVCVVVESPGGAAVVRPRSERRPVTVTRIRDPLGGSLWIPGNSTVVPRESEVRPSLWLPSGAPAGTGSPLAARRWQPDPLEIVALER